MKRLLILVFWFPLTLTTIIGSFLILGYRQNSLEKQVFAQEPKQELTFSFLPKVLGEATQAEAEESQDIPDLNPQLITVRHYLEEFRSPMAPSSELLVQTALDFDVDPFLIVAIAQCETNLGIKSPEGCLNPFGLGFYNQQRLCFADWEEAYRVMAKTLNKYQQQGLKTPEEIMIKYCPHSIQEKDGAWAKCVTRFKNEIENSKID